MESIIISNCWMLLQPSSSSTLPKSSSSLLLSSSPSSSNDAKRVDVKRCWEVKLPSSAARHQFRHFSNNLNHLKNDQLIFFVCRWRFVSWHGVAWCGLVWRGVAWCSMAWRVPQSDDKTWKRKWGTVIQPNYPALKKLSKIQSFIQLWWGNTKVTPVK